MRRVTGVSTWCLICRQYLTEGIEVDDVAHFEVICDSCAKKITKIINEEEYEKAPYKCDKCGKTFTNKGLYVAHFKHNCVKNGTNEEEGD